MPLYKESIVEMRNSIEENISMIIKVNVSKIGNNFDIILLNTHYQKIIKEYGNGYKYFDILMLEPHLVQIKTILENYLDSQEWNDICYQYVKQRETNGN
jgi:hypothetical protein